MPKFRIALVPGDGVGLEVTREAAKILRGAADKFAFGLETVQFDWGCDYFLERGAMGPPDLLERLTEFDAIFLGCIGDAQKVPDHISLQLLLTIRKGFDQYINLRPIKLYPGVESLIRTATPDTVDLVVVRENTEGEYSGIGGFHRSGTPEAVAVQTAVFTRLGCERAIRYAFELARKRRNRAGKERRGVVTNCTKSNALNYSMVFWDSVFFDVARDYPELRTDVALVDALTMWFVKNPGHFDVVVASNLFGDIITDLGSMLQGGMGFAAGGNINPEKRYPSMFEPIHGSAPKYAGKGRVNPIASIDAVRMMLEHLGESGAAAEVEAAVARVLGGGAVRTHDMGGSATTEEMGEAVLQALLE